MSLVQFLMLVGVGITMFNRTKCMKELWTEKYRPRA